MQKKKNVSKPKRAISAKRARSQKGSGRDGLSQAEPETLSALVEQITRHPKTGTRHVQSDKVSGRLMETLRKTDANSTWVDPDDAPEWTDEMFERADLYHGDKLVRRGRPPSANPKKAIKLRIDADVIERFRATGPGWQTRINDTLRRAVGPRRQAAKTRPLVTPS
jgi:uncharacterized protein (DUF4415 family)